MKQIRGWAPVASALVALASGLVPYLLLNRVGAMPLGLRDNPWPMEALSVVATVVTLVLTVRAYREKRARGVATVSAALASAATAVFLLAVHVASAAVPPPPKELAVGTVAPDFTLPDDAGHPVTLASLRGAPVLLVFYRGSWCPFCRSELAALARHAVEFERAGVKILAISVDPREESISLKGELGLGFPLLSDADARVIKQYGLLHSKGRNGELDVARPADLLLDGEGVIRWAMFTDNVRIRARPEALLAAAKQLR